MQRFRTRRAAGALAVAICIGVAGCGGDDEKSSGSESTPAAKSTPAETSSAEVSKVAMSEYKFEPGSVTVKQGATISAPNGGALQHDLKLRQGGKVVGGTELADAGKSVDFKVDVKPGTYEMFCSVPGHEQSGMKGEFTVE